MVSERPSRPLLEVSEISQTTATIRFHSKYDSVRYFFRYRRDPEDDDDEKGTEWIERTLDSGVNRYTLKGLQQKSKYELCGKLVSNMVSSRESNIISFLTLDNPKRALNGTEYRGRWISQNCGQGFRVIDDHQILFYEEAYKSAMLDMSIAVDPNSECDNIVYWQLTIDGDSSLGLFSMFGVVSNECRNIGHCAWGGLTDFYGIGCGDLVWDLGTSNTFPESNPSFRAKVGNGGISCGEIIKIGLHQRSSKLVFSRDDKELWTLQLPQRKAWYPCVSLGFGKYNYYVKLVPLSQSK